MLRVSVSVVVAVLVHVILSAPSYGAESKMERWYTLWNIGYGQNGYPLELQEVLDEINDQPNVEHSVGMTVADVLGFYVPLGEQTLIGTIINANADVYEWKDGETQVDIYNYIWGASVIHFPNAKIGQGGFVRTDLGLAFVSAEVFYDNLNSTCKCNRLGRWHRKGQLVYFPWPFQTQLPTEALMGTYHQLTEHQRYQIYALKKAGHDQQSIAATVSVSPSTICRELRRNQGQRGYRPGQAHHKALARRRHKAKATKMTAAVIERIEADLGQQWSPEQIAGRLATTDGLHLSPQRIYQHIQADRQAGGTLYRHLRHSQKKRKKRYGKADARGQIKGRVSIDQRPAIVEEKSRIGDWEIDLVMGRPRTGALVSVVERRSRYTVLGKVPSKQAEHVAAATIALLAPHKGHTQTITADNGKEFAHHATISQALDAAVYFAPPYHAWERGLNENTNGLIRQYVPKGTALDTLSQAQIHHIMERLNHRPRKGLAFQTPHEILCKETEVQPKQGEIALTS